MEKIDTTSPAGKAMCAVNDWIANAKGSEYGFIQAVFSAFTQFNDGNRDALAKLMTVANGKTAKRIRHVEGNKLVYAAVLKRLCAHVIPAVSAKYNATSDFGVAWTVKTGANSPVDVEALGRLEQWATLTDKLGKPILTSAFNKGFKEAFPAIKATPKEKTDREVLDANAAKVVKMIEDNDIPLSVLMHRVQALMSGKVNNEPAH